LARSSTVARDRARARQQHREQTEANRKERREKGTRWKEQLDQSDEQSPHPHFDFSNFDAEMEDATQEEEKIEPLLKRKGASRVCHPLFGCGADFVLASDRHDWPMGINPGRDTPEAHSGPIYETDDIAVKRMRTTSPGAIQREIQQRRRQRERPKQERRQQDAQSRSQRVMDQLMRELYEEARREHEGLSFSPYTSSR
jgi:hypothetical protein